jgi:hypothetical protein
MESSSVSPTNSSRIGAAAVSNASMEDERADEEPTPATKKKKLTSASSTATSSSSSPSSKQDSGILCSFCQSEPAAVLVPLPSLRKRNKTISTPFCLLHYYTTSAVRVVDGGVVVTVPDPAVAPRQPLPLPPQDVFAEAYVQLQQELCDATLQQYATDDPLAILANLNQSSTTAAGTVRRTRQRIPPLQNGRRRGPTASSTSTNPAQQETQQGGFLQSAPIPERLLRTQEQQKRRHTELIARMNASSAATTTNNTTQRRKPSRTSIWNVIDEKKRASNEATLQKKRSPAGHRTEHADQNPAPLDVQCTCGKGERGSVQILFTNSGSLKNQDTARAETWGLNKDREGEVITRYQCSACGKVWTEEE